MNGRIGSYVLVFVVLAGMGFSHSHGLSSNAPGMDDLFLPVDFYPSNSTEAVVENVSEEPEAPGFLAFTVSSTYSVHTVHGLSNLRKYLHEISVLQKLKNDKRLGGGIAAGAVDSVKDTVVGFKNLVVDPIGSVTALGRGFGKLGDRLGDAFRKKEKGEKGDDSYLLSSTKREVADNLGVDVYTRNAYLQKKLDLMATARVGGRGAMAIATFFLPVGVIASAVMTAGSINKAADELVNDTDRRDLYMLNRKALLNLGIAREKVIRFLNHSYYTPRELTYFRFYLERLREAEGFESILDAASEAATGVPSDKILHEAQIVADATADSSQITEIVPTREGILVEMQHKVFLATAYDYLDVSPLSESLAKRVLAFEQIVGKQSAEIRSGGAVSCRLDDALFLKGIGVEKMCLFDKAAGESLRR